MSFQPKGPTDLSSLKRIINRRRKVNTAARLRLGRLVTSVEDLARLADARRSVFCDGAWGLLPARVVMNMTAGVVHRAISDGRMSLYCSKDWPAKLAAAKSPKGGAS